jgi:hypothetical protein
MGEAVVTPRDALALLLREFDADMLAELVEFAQWLLRDRIELEQRWPRGTAPWL